MILAKITTFLISLVILSSIGHAVTVVPLDTSFKLKMGNSVLVQGTDLEITLKNVGTVHPVKGSVVTIVTLVIRKNGSNEELSLDTIHTKTSEESLGNYKIVLEDADGYQAKCVLKVFKIR